MTLKHRQRSLGTGLLIAVLAAFALARTAGGVIDLDLFHEMALAREIAARGSVPWADSFAYTPTVPIVVHHEWGLGVIALALSGFGGGAIIALKFLLIFGLGAVVWRTARRRGAPPVIVTLFLAIGMVLSDFGFATVRAQMFSYLFAAVLLQWFDDDRRGRRGWLIGLAILFPLWANLHGGCLVGAALLAVHWFEQCLAGRPHWHLLAAGMMLVPLAALNPWGFHYHEYLVYAITMPRPAIAEWAPLWHSSQRRELINFIISLLPWLVVWRSGVWKRSSRLCRDDVIPAQSSLHPIRRVLNGLPGLLILFATAFAAVKSNRFLPFYAIAFASYLPETFSRTPIGRDLRRGWRRNQLIWQPVLGLAVITLLLQAARSEPWRLQVASHPLSAQGTHLIYPVGVVDYLRQQGFRGNVMVPYDWGSYVMWTLGPDVKVSFDSRYEVAYPLSRMDEDDQFYQAHPGWQELLTRYPTDVVLSRSDLPVVRALEQEPDWMLYYADPQFVLFGRRTLGWPVTTSSHPAPEGRFP